MKRANGSGAPGPEECRAIMARFQMPEHIVRHCRAVCRVAEYLSARLSARGLALDPDMIRAGALLHDITKRFSFDRPLDHALTGAKLVNRLGYPDIAPLVRQHVRLSASRPPGRVTEVEIINYADKRVVEDQVTLLADRLAYIRRRYGKTPEALARIDRYSAQTVELEQDIYVLLEEEPERLLVLNEG